MHKILFPLLLILLLLQPSCRQNDFPSPLRFNACEHNPVLVPGEPGSWDDLSTGVPNIVWHDSMFYLFYMGRNVAGRIAIGLATSHDGVHYKKFGANPVLASDNNGFDAFTVGPGIVVKEDSVWVMYFNALETAGFTPGPSIGRATATILTGPWKRRDTPVLKTGNKGEWDAGFVIPSTVLALKEGSYIMYYSGGNDYNTLNDFFVGMATSTDGMNWKKYNDPATTQHPFAESDPVFMNGSAGDWDGNYVWMANVTRYSEGFRMYYTGVPFETNIVEIGYATSKDGIHWERYPGNPVCVAGNDLFQKTKGVEGYMENPSVLFLDTICYMYYDCGIAGKIGLATARVH
jgi:hypothetical protein